MPSLWGTKDQKSSEEEENGRGSGEGSNPAQERRSQDRADERTRLLPQPHRDGYLDPDDPAVSPYNLWSVRAIRYFAIIFLAMSFLWWVLLLVSIFVSPPGMHSRGSGFFDFSYTTLTLGNLLVSILFFSIPSKALEVTSMAVALLLLVDMIIIVSVPQLRSEEGWVGISSVVWAFFIAGYNVVSDRVVAYGKREEEERLTGRSETRRSLREWCAVMTYTVIMVIIIIVTILLTGTLIIRAQDASVEVPGTRWYVDDGKYQVHLECTGNETYADEGYPTVLIEAGENPFKGTLEPSIYRAYRSGAIPRYCYWDRPGLAFSDNAPSPHSASMSVDALSEALAQAGEEGPFILVSAGIGSIYSRVFSSRHRGDVKAIMMIDPLHEDYLYQVGDPSHGFSLWARGIISPLGLQRIPGAMFKGRTREDRVYGRVAYQSGKYIKSKLQENLVASSLTKTAINQARNIQDKVTPLVVVSSGIKYRSDDDWADKQQALTKITDKLLAWDVVRKAPHEVWTTKEGEKVIRQRIEQLIRL